MTHKLVFGTGGRFGRLSERESIDLVGFALSNEILKFDTGVQYCKGQSQPLLYKSLFFHGFSRSEITVCSKISAELLLTLDKDELRSCLFSGFDDYLQYLDVLMLWGPSVEQLSDVRLIDNLARLQQEGLIKRIGVNTHHSHVMQFISCHRNLRCVDDLMVDFNILQNSRSFVIDSFKSSVPSRRVWAGTSLCQGFLVQSLFSMYVRSRSFSYLARAFLNPPTRQYLNRSAPVRRLLQERFGPEWKKAPLSYVLHQPSVSFVPLGMLSKSSIMSNVDTATFPIDVYCIEDFVSKLPGSLLVDDVFS